MLELQEFLQTDAASWLGLCIICLFIEGITTDLTAIWFAAGALVASILATFTSVPIIGQFLIGAVVSAICLAILKPLMKSKLNHKTEKTNCDEIIGEKVIINQEVINSGRVSLKGTTWKIEYKGSLKLNQELYIQNINGVTLILGDIPE